MKQGKFNILMGAQAGSESKGKMGAFLVAKFKPEIICIASSPNSGHTVVMGDHKYVTYHLPVSWVANRDAKILLGPSSVINLPILEKEIASLLIPRNKLKVNPRAVMIRPHYLHEEKECGLLKIGSTNQGVGVARREKIMRNPDITFAKDVEFLKPFLCDTAMELNLDLNRGKTVLCEMTQGFDLDLEHGIDPYYCTSKMIHPAMAMAEAGVSPRMVGDIYGVLRPYPIRVNNRDGSSGPYADAEEITWRDVAMRSGYPYPDDFGEITTTTKLPRRVFEFSTDRLIQFAIECGPTRMCLQFANYIDHSVFKGTDWASVVSNKAMVRHFIQRVETLSGAPVAYVGTGPDHCDMVDRFIDTID